MHSRSFLTRLILAVLGMLLFWLAGYIGLGWAVRDSRAWVVDRLGEERWLDFHCAYAQALAVLFSVDSDGDGFPDSAERYLGNDPHDPLNRPETFFLDHRGFTGGVVFPGQMGLERDLILLEPGERRRMRVRVGILRHPAAFAPGMRLFLTPDPPLRLAPPGATPTGAPFLAPVAADGTMEFDLAVADDADVGPASFSLTRSIMAEHPVAKVDPNPISLNFVVAWRQPPVPYTVEDVSSDDPLRGEYLPSGRALKTAGQPLSNQLHTVRLTWQPAGPSGWQYIEATRDESGREWFPIGVCPAKDHSCVVAYRLDSASGYEGPLKFRVVPTRAIPPRW